MSENRCRFCGYTIVWCEGRGWNRTHFGTVLWNTEDCPERDDPSKGHALPQSVTA